MKRIICLLIAIVMTAAVLSGCVSKDKPDETTAPETTTVAAGTPDGTTVDAGTPDVTTGELPPDDASLREILLADITNYTVVRSENGGDAAGTALMKIIDAIEEKYGMRLQAKDDFFREGIEALKIGEFEILIGNTNREESQEFLSTIKSRDYGYKIIGQKLVIGGYTDETTAAAVDLFISDMRANTSETEFFSNDNAYLFSDNYDLDSLKLNGVDIGKYSIVFCYKNKLSERVTANGLRDGIAELCGVYLTVISDNEDIVPEYSIIVGESSQVSEVLKAAKTTAGTLESDRFYLGSDDKTVWLSADNAVGIMAASSKLIKSITATEGAKTVDLLVEPGIFASFDGELLKVMSFNVLVSKKTAERTDRVIEMIENYMPDTFGVQEASPAWMSDLKNRLGGFYACVGEGRNGGSSGEYSAVFYLKDKFSLISTDTKWLSATPDTANSKYSESSYPRIMTYAVLERKSDGQRFIHVNTHLEHTSDEARKKQVAVLLAEIAKLEKLPTVITGDFNAKKDTTVYNTVAKIYPDAATIAISAKTGSTFHNYGAASSIIDFIFISTPSIIVETYKVCNEKINGDYASDHHPIYAEIVINK